MSSFLIQPFKDALNADVVHGEKKFDTPAV